MFCEGKIIDGIYRIAGELGSGGGGIVYKAYHMRLKKYVAIKYIKNIAQNSPEVDILKNLNSSYIPKIYDFIHLENETYIVMDFIEGKDFEHIVSENYDYDVNNALDWAIQICEAVEYLHTRKKPIIHSDIKPSNIMLTDENKICLIDFNISAVLDSESGAFVKGASANYAAPEQLIQVERDSLKGKNVILKNRAGNKITSSSVIKSIIDERTDIFSIGASLYYIFTKNVPVGGKADFSDIKIPVGIKRVIDKAMKYYPADRYSSAALMKDDLLKLKNSKFRTGFFSVFSAKPEKENNNVYLNVAVVEKNTVKDKFVSDCNAEYFNKCGNTSANCMNGGLCACQHNNIYFSLENGIYKSLYGGESVKISDESASFINIYGDYIYYRSNSDNGKLCSMRTDGKLRRVFSENNVSDVMVYNDIIYCIDRTNGGKLSKCDIENSFHSTVIDEKILSYCINNEKLYYCSEESSYNIICSDIYGQKRETVNNEHCNMISCFKNKIFYLSYTENGFILKFLDENNAAKNLISNITISSYQISDESIVCLTNAKDEFRIIKYQFDRKYSELVKGKFFSNINISCGKLFYYDMISGQTKYISMR